MRQRRRLHIAAPILVLAVAGIAPGGDGAFRGEIRIGATLPLTGELDAYGQSAYYGVMTSVKVINSAGGINGKRLEVEWRDNRSDPRQSIRDIEELVGKFKVPAVIGPLFSDSIASVIPVAERLGVVVISPMATMDAITRERPWVFRAGFSNSDQVNALVRFQMEKYGAATCGILYNPRFNFSRELSAVFEHRFAAAGGRVVGRHPFVDEKGKKDYETPLKRLAADNPDFIFAPCVALEATELIRTAKALGIRTRFSGSHTWDIELVFDATGSRLVGTSFTSALFEQGFSYRPFRAFFDAMLQAGMDNPDAEAALAYDSVVLLAEALKKGETPEAVRQALLAIRNLPLATGRTTIGERGETRKPVLIRVVERRNGRLIPVYAERYDPVRD